MHTTLVINPKGGSGKTTVTSNLASYFAVNNISTAILDYDPLGSSLNWLGRRAADAKHIHGGNAAPAKAGRLRSIDMFIPPRTEQLIIDSPGGASGLLLKELLALADCIVVPVMPSAIDMHATANFVKDLMLMGKIRARSVRLGFVSNRVRSSTPLYPPLQRFLATLNLPLLTRLDDSDVYIKAAETGIGIFEMDPSLSAVEREQFMPIVEWVAGPQALPHSRGAENVVSLDSRRLG